MKKLMKKPEQSPKNRKIKKKPTDLPKVQDQKVKSTSKSISIEAKDSRKSISKSKSQKDNLKDSKNNQEKEVKGMRTRTKSKVSPINEQKLKLASKDKKKILPKVSKGTSVSSSQKVEQSKKKKQPSPTQDNPTKSLKMMQRYCIKSIVQQLKNYKCQLSEDKKYKITLHDNYQISQTHKLYPFIERLFKLFLQKEKRKSESIFVKTRYSFFPVFEFLLSDEHVGDHKCCICQFQFQEPKDINEMEKLLLDINDSDVVALKCSHLLHLECLKMLIGDKEWFKCPVCSMIYGKMIGDQPQGTMTSSVNEWMKCEGYPDVGTIVLHYSMRGGRRGDLDYPSTGRTAYLPNTIEGNQVLRLLRQAFDRKLIFTIGRSVTTGRDNQIVWNGIHHKTNLTGGSAYFGYPDLTYFDRVKLQLAAKGVF